MPKNIIEKGFIFAGLSNILGVLICSIFFTNQIMMETQPSVMSFFGLISIVLWGLAYIAVYKTYIKVRWLIGVFVIEKLVYVIAWLAFMSSQSLADIYEKDILSGIFYTIYGPNDFFFMIFFAYVFLLVTKSKPNSTLGK